MLRLYCVLILLLVDTTYMKRKGQMTVLTSIEMSRGLRRQRIDSFSSATDDHGPRWAFLIMWLVCLFASILRCLKKHKKMQKSHQIIYKMVRADTSDEKMSWIIDIQIHKRSTLGRTVYSDVRRLLKIKNLNFKTLFKSIVILILSLIDNWHQ